MKKILVLTTIGLITGIVYVNAQTEKQKPPPPPPPKPKEAVKYTIVDEKVKTPPVITVSGKMADDFYKRNSSVSEISRQGNITILKMKNGATEKYDMSRKEEDKRFTEKYGRSPIPPPPPPPKPEKEIKNKIVKDEKVKTTA